MTTSPVPIERFPTRDEDVAAFVRSLGLDGHIDIHVHSMPDRIQAAVWAYFDGLEAPGWPITYRLPEDDRLDVLAALGVARHTTLAYPHRAGVASWLNDHTLAIAARAPQVIPTFTFHPEPGIADEVARCLAGGGQVAKVHLQVGRFDTLDALLDDVWPQLVAARTVVVIHAAAVYGVEGGQEHCGADPVRRLLARHPDLVLVIAHLGGPEFDDFLDLADELEAAGGALHFDTAMVLTDPPFLGVVRSDHRRRIAERPDRLLFGSDFPSIPHAYAAQLRGLAALELDEAGLGAVMRGNAERLLGGVRRP